MSYTASPTVDPDSASSGALQAWATIVEAAFTGSGWTVTADTGQTAPGSMTAPSGNDDYHQYRIYAMGDALQGSNPIYVKIGYGSGSANCPGMQVSIGTGTNGSGTLTGVLSDAVNITSGGNRAGIPYQCYLCGDTNRIGVMMWSDPSFNSGENCMFFNIERTKNASSGADTAAGVHFFWESTDGRGSYTSHSDGPSQCGFEVVPFDGTPKVLVSPWVIPVSPLNSLQNSTDNTVGILFPVPMGYQPYPPGLGILCYQGSDFSPYATVAIPNVYGATHTYRVMSQNSNLGPRVYNGAGVSAAHLMMRWE